VTETVQPQPAVEPARPVNALGAGMLVLWLGIGVALQNAQGQAGPLTFAFVLLGWVLSVMAHEFSHAAVAYVGGDVTVVEKGYLSFDPRRYGDVGVSLVLPLLALVLGGVGFPGGAVYLRNDLMRGPGWRAAASLAGPAATLAVLLALTTVLRLWAAQAPPTPLFLALTVLAFLQAMALILNLLPLPGLDGFNVIRPFLPRSLAPLIRKGEGLVMAGLFLAIFLLPGLSAGLFRAAAGLSATLGVDIATLQEGWRAFHFWL
jgi:Zn-dependent protease